MELEQLITQNAGALPHGVWRYWSDRFILLITHHPDSWKMARIEGDSARLLTGHEIVGDPEALRFLAEAWTCFYHDKPSGQIQCSIEELLDAGAYYAIWPGAPFWYYDDIRSHVHKAALAEIYKLVACAAFFWPDSDEYLDALDALVASEGVQFVSDMAIKFLTRWGVERA